MLIKKQKIPVGKIITIGFLPSSIKKLYYRIKGYKIGKGVRLGLGSVIIGEQVSIGDYTSVGFLSVIRGKIIDLKRFIKIGSIVFIDTEKIFIDDDARINENVIIGGIKFPDSSIEIGKRTIIMEYSFINPTKPIKIGDDTGIGGHCLLFTHGSWLPQIDGYPVTFAPITLGKKVWLPWRVFIMPGVEIGDNVVVGANSLVSKSFPSHTLIAGSPAKILKENYPGVLSKEERRNIVENIFSQFIAHLEYHGLNVSEPDFEPGRRMIVQKNDVQHELIYLVKEQNLMLQDNSVLILDYPEANKPKLEQNSMKMILDLETRERGGTSAIGEEFAQFLSRFGIRFERID